MWCSAVSCEIQRTSIHGHRNMTVNMMPGMTTDGMNTDGIVMPRMVHSQAGHSRSRPSNHPMYQSGWEGAKTSKGSYGPYSHTALISNRPPSSDRTAAVNMNSARHRDGLVGPQRFTDDVVLGGTGASLLGVLLAHHDGEVGAQHADQQCRQHHDVEDVQTAEDERARVLATQSQVAEQRTDEGDGQQGGVADAQARARQQVVGQRVAGEAGAEGQQQQDPPMTQFSSRGRRNDPVKKTRRRCTTMAATNSSAAQWWTWRISSPARISKDRRIVESKAALISWPCSGT